LIKFDVWFVIRRGVVKCWTENCFFLKAQPTEIPDIFL